MTDLATLAFIGLGKMGAGIAGNLIRAGYRVTLFNRTQAKLAPLVELGGKAAGTIAEACAGADLLITMLADDQAIESSVLGPDGALPHLPEGALHICHGTISAALARRLAEAHGRAGQCYLSAPVFGRPEAAETAKLFVLTSGPDPVIERALPLLGVIGQRVFRLGDKPEAANIGKLGGNMLIAAVIESLGEVLALAAKAGIDQADYLDMLTSTLFAAPVYKTYGRLIVEQHYEPAGFTAPLGLKDVGLVLAAGQELSMPLPIASLLRDRFLALLAQGGQNLDWSAIASLAARDAGLD
jgi:3-hydroxyisobutyrate dehydrogenase-like beta-hydroxyacid dehydrogenase